MKAQFWLQKWQANKIGFHKTEVHELVKQHWSSLDLAAGARVLVPLCGKSVDMIWLVKQGHPVVGIELSQVAAETFFSENNLTPLVTEAGEFTRYRVNRLEIIVGDFFAIPGDLVGPVDAIYDRAALVALPDTQRHQYVHRLSELGNEGHRALLVSLEYIPDTVTPPPFSMEHSDIETLLEPTYRVDHLDTIASDVKGAPARESVYRLVSTPPPEIDAGNRSG